MRQERTMNQDQLDDFLRAAALVEQAIEDAFTVPTDEPVNSNCQAVTVCLGSNGEHAAEEG